LRGGDFDLGGGNLILAHQEITVHLPRFEGPLPLLLYLIKREQMDIFDIEITKITAQYLDFIRTMRAFDIEVASEFISMAATLIEIKSKMLLPQYDADGEVIEDKDPRKKLVARILEYQKAQEAAYELKRLPILGQRVWARGVFPEVYALEEQEEVLVPRSIFDLIRIYSLVQKKAKRIVHKVTEKIQSVASRIYEIAPFLSPGEKVALTSLLTFLPTLEQRRRQLLISFLSSLELAKMGLAKLFQTESFSEIYIEATRTLDQIVLQSLAQNVEEYAHEGKEGSVSFNG
jgi:segregation and condensation protein A